jgi:hypothetical protein
VATILPSGFRLRRVWANDILSAFRWGVVFILDMSFKSGRADSLAQRAKCQLDGGFPSVA